MTERKGRKGTIDGQFLKRALLGGLARLNAHHEDVNRINVFPVPDGDTGTNMLLTLQAAVEDIRESEETDISKVARNAAHRSMMGARGNSGIILSQILRGFASAVVGKAELTPDELAGALKEAANAAYRAVPTPTEGTILTVIRQAERSATLAAAQPGASAISVLRSAAAGARAAVERTPTQLRILRETDVVDAGGYGVQLLLEGMARHADEATHEARLTPLLSPAQMALDLPEEGWGYCTEFLVNGDELDVNAIREAIAALGDSVVVVGDPDVIRVHVHTDDPSQVIKLCYGYGRIDRLNVGDMSSQHRRIREASSEKRQPVRGSAAVPPTRPAHPWPNEILAIDQGSSTEVARSLAQLAQAALHAHEYDDDQREELTEQIENLATELRAEVPRQSRLRAFAAVIGGLAQLAPGVLQAWNALSPIIFQPSGEALRAPKGRRRRRQT